MVSISRLSLLGQDYDGETYFLRVCVFIRKMKKILMKIIEIRKEEDDNRKRKENNCFRKRFVYFCFVVCLK